MTEIINQKYPEAYEAIAEKTSALGFDMPSDIYTCSFLHTLAATKPAGKLLELGTGAGLSTAWILNGMGANATLTSIDNDPVLLEVAVHFLGADSRLQLLQTDGGDWVNKNKGGKYDFIFADTWHGKYLMLEEVLDMLNPGGIYVVDDMLPQENWPTGHAEKALNLEAYLDSREDFFLSKLSWATGIITAVRIK